MTFPITIKICTELWIKTPCVPWDSTPLPSLVRHSRIDQKYAYCPPTQIGIPDEDQSDDQEKLFWHTFMDSCSKYIYLLNFLLLLACPCFLPPHYLILISQGLLPSLLPLVRISSETHPIAYFLQWGLLILSTTTFWLPRCRSTKVRSTSRDHITQPHPSLVFLMLSFLANNSKF